MHQEVTVGRKVAAIAGGCGCVRRGNGGTA